MATRAETIEHRQFELPNTCIVFNGKTRKTLVEGVLQDIKGMYESKTNGLVSICYEEFKLGDHEFCFKLAVSKEESCKKQMFYETTAAVVGAVNYMFQGSSEQYDISILADDDKLEVEIVSNW